MRFAIALVACAGCASLIGIGDAQSGPLPVPGVVHVVVRAGTADPAPELDYTVTVGVAM